MPSILFIAPKDEYDMGGKKFIPNLSLSILAAYTPKHYNIKIIDEGFEKINFNSNIDLVAITTNSGIALRAYKIAVEFMIRGIPVIIGGIHASFVPKEAKQFCSSVVVGEAEGVWPRVLKDFEKGKLKSFYKSELLNISKLKNPRRELYPGKFFFENVQTSRGCPFNCDFCSVTAFNGGKYRYKIIRNVIREISKIKSKHLLIVDDNILGVGKKAEERTLRLLRELKPLNKKWVTQASVNICENKKILNALADSGCIGLYIGFESINTKFLEGINKKVNVRLKVKKYKYCIKELHNSGLHVWGSFMLGHDYETKKTIEETTNFILENNIYVNLNPLTPIIGTKFYEDIKRQGRLLHEKYWLCEPRPYVVHKPKNISPEELFNAIVDSGLRIYKTKNNFLRYFNNVKVIKKPFYSTIGFISNFGIKNFYKTYRKRGFIGENTKSKEDELIQRLQQGLHNVYK